MLSLAGQSTTATFAPGNVSPDRAGFIMIPGQSTAPQGWLTCDGTPVSRTTYTDLFTAIGTAFGVGDGSTTFNLPDLSIDVGGVVRNCVIKAFNDSGSVNFSTTQAIIDSATIYSQLATGPSSPATGYLAIYAKNDGNFYKKTPAGVESQIGISPSDASPTVPGIVNLTNQSFAGTKVFRDGVRGVNQQLAKSPTMARNLGLSPRPQSIAVTTGSSPQRVTTDGTSMWVACNSGTVTKINPKTQVVTGTITPGGQPRYVLFDGINIWAACGPNDFIKKINPNTNLVTATINFTAADNPSGMAFDGAFLWVARQGSNSIAKINTTTDTIVASVTVGNSPSNIEFDGTNIWVSNKGSGTVSKVDPVANSVLATVTVGSNPVGSVFDGRNLWVLSNAQNRIDKIDVNTDTNLLNIAVGSNPEEVTTDGAFLYTTNLSSSSVTKISIFTNTVVGTYTGVPNAKGIIFDGSSHIWVTDPFTTNVYVLPTYNA